MTRFAIPFPAIDPVLIEVGPLAIRWYALAYIVGIFLGWWYAKTLVRNQDIIDGNYSIHWLEQFLAKGGMDG